MGNHKSTRLPSTDGLRDFWMRMLVPGAFLLLLLILLIANRPSQDLVASVVVVGLGLMASGAVGVSTGIRGPAWVIYVLILLEVALLLLLPSVWRGLALVCVPVSAIGFMMGREIAFLRNNSHQKFSSTTWIVTGEPVTDVKAAKRLASSRLSNWESIKDGRFVVALGHRRFEAWGASQEGFIVHAVLDDRDLGTMLVLTRVPRQDDEVAIPLDSHGLMAWVPRGVKVPAIVAEQALDAFFESQGAGELTGWTWQGGERTQELRFR